MAVDTRKHEAPASGEAPRRQAFNDLSLSINDFIPVANTTERAQVLAAVGSSAARPLLVWRANAEPSPRMEIHDGSRWRVLASTHLGTARLPSAQLVVAASNSVPWTDLATLTAITLGGTVGIDVSTVIGNVAATNSPRYANMRVVVDGVGTGNPPSADYFLRNESVDTREGASYYWESAPSAGQHTWTLQCRSDVGPNGSVRVFSATMRLTEYP